MVHLKKLIAPSLLSGDFAQLDRECQRMVSYGADWIHVDVMDGHFVPNLTLGPPIVKCIRKHTDGFLDCHLMVSNPGQWVDDFAEAGVNSVTFHIESLSDANKEIRYREAQELCKKIRSRNMRVGVSIKPKTEIDSIMPLCEQGLVDMVLVMTVEPGFGGQSFMPECMSKVEQLRTAFPLLDIQVDGGINLDNIGVASDAGANIFVAGNSIFGASDPKTVIARMKDIVHDN